MKYVRQSESVSDSHNNQMLFIAYYLNIITFSCHLTSSIINSRSIFDVNIKRMTPDLPLYLSISFLLITAYVIFAFVKSNNLKKNNFTNNIGLVCINLCASL